MNRGAESQAFQMAVKDRIVEPTIYIASAEGLRNVPLDQDNKRRIKTIDCQKMVNYVPKIDENLFPSASLGNQDIFDENAFLSEKFSHNKSHHDSACRDTELGVGRHG